MSVPSRDKEIETVLPYGAREEKDYPYGGTVGYAQEKRDTPYGTVREGK
jgi:hypothetical protein